jgi:hypothetical protein
MFTSRRWRLRSSAPRGQASEGENVGSEANGGDEVRCDDALIYSRKNRKHLESFGRGARCAPQESLDRPRANGGSKGRNVRVRAQSQPRRLEWHQSPPAIRGVETASDVVAIGRSFVVLLSRHRHDCAHGISQIGRAVQPDEAGLSEPHRYLGSLADHDCQHIDALVARH